MQKLQAMASQNKKEKKLVESMTTCVNKIAAQKLIKKQESFVKKRRLPVLSTNMSEIPTISGSEQTCTVTGATKTWKKWPDN